MAGLEQLHGGVTQVLLFYKRKLKELTGRLRQEGVQHGEVQVVDESLDDKLNALRSLAGEFDLSSPPLQILVQNSSCLVGENTAPSAAGHAEKLKPEPLFACFCQDWRITAKPWPTALRCSCSIVRLSNSHSTARADYLR